jgi:hypothetical protein
MKRFIILTCFFSVLAISATKPDRFPEARISNGLIVANLFLPDAENGYYKATRFDWSGVISSLEFKGHQYFGQWFENYSPDIHDAIMGPVEEFTPVGFDAAKPGEAFLKPGVGMLVKPDDTPYSSFRLYKIKNAGSWKVTKTSDQVEFIQVLQDAVYSYEYKKSVQLTQGKSEMVLIHTLKNTGLNPVETNIYDHNFFIIDNYHPGPNVRVKFTFNPGGTFQGPQDITNFQNHQLLFKRELVRGENIYCGGLSGVGDTPKDYDICLENIKTGAGVRITSDQPLLKLVFWACPTTACPEPYIHAKIDPGKEFSWKIRYEFYTFNKEN